MMAMNLFNRQVAILVIILTPIVGLFVGFAAAFFIVGVMTDWHPDVGGAFALTFLSLFLGGSGLGLGFWAAYRMYARGMRS